MIIIRPVTSRDIQQINQVATETWISTYQDIYSMEFINKFLNNAYSIERLRQSIERDSQNMKRQFLVAENEGQVVGYAQINQMENEEYELLRIYIKPDFQQKGIGTLFINEIIRVHHPLNKLIAWVQKENKAGRTFYEKKGFIINTEVTEIIEGQPKTQLKYELVISEEQYRF
jgi:ribosomal protein S18 acetylase RimI-like enzyme